MPFLTKEKLHKIGFASLGENVFISDKASFYNPSNISIGSYIRIDDFCVLSAGNGGIELSDFVHIGCQSSMIGEEKIKMGYYSGLSSKVSIYSSNDDFSGDSLPGVKIFIPEQFRKLTIKPVTLESYTIIGSNSVILPGVTIGEGAVVGALSFVRKNCKPWFTYSGNPLRCLRKRSHEMLKFIPELRKMQDDGLIQVPHYGNE
ncbi:MAG TPA: acyltransferase [Hanamia sp.]|nr:acyltransferase [Hanamia sp.]